MSKFLAILASTAFECELLITALKAKSPLQLPNRQAFKGSLDGRDCIICITGIGKVNSAYAMTLLAERYPQVEAVLNIGIAGAYPETDLALFDIVGATKEVYADEGLLCRYNFIDLSALRLPVYKLGDKVFFNELPVKAIDAQIKQGGFATVSSCAGTHELGVLRRRLFDCVCENMEGSAIAHICLQYNKPFYELRCISNIVQDRDGPISKTDIVKSAKMLQEFVLQSRLLLNLA